VLLTGSVSGRVLSFYIGPIFVFAGIGLEAPVLGLGLVPLSLC